VSKHDKVPHHVLNIDESFRRLAPTRSVESLSFAAGDETGDGGGANLAANRLVLGSHLLIDPESNNLLKTYKVAPRELGVLHVPNWAPSIKLTEQEQALVDRDGSVMVSGRSGTGKTLCLLSRMERDSRLNPHARQLFVCRTKVSHVRLLIFH
jgi:hypothetical protein